MDACRHHDTLIRFPRTLLRSVMARLTAASMVALVALAAFPARALECGDVFGGRVRYWATSSLLDHYKGEELGREIEVTNGEHTRSVFFYTKYLGPKEAAAYEIHVRDGLLVDARGELLDTRFAMIFVMTPEGTIYATNRQQVGIFHHSTFVAGRPVAAAGEFWVREGVLERISARSGHYQPSWVQIRQFMRELQRRGAAVPQTAKETFDPPPRAP